MTDEATDSAAVREVPARLVPAPHSIGPEARARLAMEWPQMPPMPPLGDKAAWRQVIDGFNAILASMIRLRVGDTGVRLRVEEIGGVTVYVAEPPVARSDERAIVFFHGGGLVMAGGESCGLMAFLEAERTGLRVYGVDFGNPPDHPYPDALNDGLAVYRALLERHSSSSLVISGASGGGNLAVALTLRARDLGLPMPTAVGLFTPHVDLTMSGDTFRTNAGVDTLGGIALETMNALYAGDHDLADPWVSPLFGDFSGGFPPTFIQSGTRDSFLSSAVRLHRRLRDAGVDAELHVGEAMPHGGFGGGIADIPEDMELRLEFNRFLIRHAGS